MSSSETILGGSTGMVTFSSFRRLSNLAKPFSSSHAYGNAMSSTYVDDEDAFGEEVEEEEEEEAAAAAAREADEATIRWALNLRRDPLTSRSIVFASVSAGTSITT